MTDWMRPRDYKAELAMASGIKPKRPDGWTVYLGLRKVRILEFTRCNHYRPDWREATEDYKTDRYQMLCDKMTARVVSGDSRFHPRDPGLPCRPTSLTALGIMAARVDRLMSARAQGLPGVLTSHFPDCSGVRVTAAASSLATGPAETTAGARDHRPPRPSPVRAPYAAPAQRCRPAPARA
jgi:hypothetical protein